MPHALRTGLPKLAVDRADVAEDARGLAPGVVGAHPGLDEFAGPHLEVKRELVPDIAGRIRADIGPMEDALHHGHLAPASSVPSVEPLEA